MKTFLYLLLFAAVETACMSLIFAGHVSGEVRLEGIAPEPVTVTLKSKRPEQNLKHCGARTRKSKRLKVDADGRVANAVVWISGEQEGPGPRSNDKKWVLDQRRCTFLPHVLLVPKGSQVHIRNSDPMDHNIRIFKGRSMQMHQDHPLESEDIVWPFEDEGRYLVRCGFHHWMHAWVIVTDAQYYARSDADGRFDLKELKPGRYQLHAWHETLGELEQEIEVKENLPLQIQLTYPSPKGEHSAS